MVARPYRTTMIAAALITMLTGCQQFRPTAPPILPPATTLGTMPTATKLPMSAATSARASDNAPPIVRGQDPGYGGRSVGTLPSGYPAAQRYTAAPASYPAAQTAYGTAPSSGATTYPSPAGTGLNQPIAAAKPSLPYGGQVLPVNQPPFVPDSPLVLAPPQPININSIVEETQTGRFMMGLGVNSDAGLIGNIVIDEQNFDFTRIPTSFADLADGTAFRGAGQRFRLEALPGTQVSRYSASFSEPYLMGSAISFGLSGFYYERRFTDWEERRFGGRLSLGYIFPEQPYLSTTASLRYEEIDISRPSVPTPAELAEVLGSNDLISFRWEVAHDTRDNSFLPSDGHLIRLSFEQAGGTFVYPRFEGDYRKYFVMHERPDGSGRHVFGLSGKLGIAGDDTPIYDHFYAGGFSTIRGFDFRGASPKVGSVIVGGEFQLLLSTEYRFPLTHDDNLFGSFFLDMGTVERDITINADNFRITPGFELRINVPALGPVPLAVGFGVPIAHAPGDDIRNFHFFVGVSR